MVFVLACIFVSSALKTPRFHRGELSASFCVLSILSNGRSPICLFFIEISLLFVLRQLLESPGET